MLRIGKFGGWRKTLCANVSAINLKTLKTLSGVQETQVLLGTYLFPYTYRSVYKVPALAKTSEVTEIISLCKLH